MVRVETADRLTGLNYKYSNRMFSRRAELRPLAAFFVLAAVINVVASFATRLAVDPSRRMLVASGACFDVIFVVSALYYWLLVRPAYRTPQSLWLVALAGIARSVFLLPAGTVGRAIAIAACECGFIAIVVCVVRGTRKGEDPDIVAKLQGAMMTVIPARSVAQVLASELCIWYFAFGAWRRPRLSPNVRAFTIHQRSGKADLFAAAAIGSLFEIFPVHLLLRSRSHALAWVATSVSFYGAIWLMALSKSFSLRPILVAGDFLAIRSGLLFDLRLTHGDVSGVYCADSIVTIELSHAMTARGPMGIPKRVERVQIAPDDLAGFQNAIQEWREGH